MAITAADRHVQLRRVLTHSELLGGLGDTLTRFITEVHSDTELGQHLLFRLSEAANNAARSPATEDQMVLDAAAGWIAYLANFPSDLTLSNNDHACIAALSARAKVITNEGRLASMFDAVIVKTRELYDEDFPSAPTFKIGLLGSRPKHPFCLSGETRPRVDPEVVLSFQPSSYGPLTHASALLVLVHESVCHVASSDSTVNNHSMFAEGFMDWVAMRCFERWVTAISGSQHRCAAEQGAALAWAEGGQGRKGHYRGLGHDAATAVVGRLEADGHGNAALLLESTALRLNRDSATLAEKDNIVLGLLYEFDAKDWLVVTDVILGRRPLEDLIVLANS